MEETFRTSFTHIRLIVAGAIALFESDGQRIADKLQDEEHARLSASLESIGEALQ